MENKEKEIMIGEEVMDLLQIGKSTLHSWRNQGYIKAYGIGGRVYYKRSEILEAFIKIN